MKKKKNSALRKLVPATCMLLVSATMLASSTYAWFTMSREVELKNIQMTATVPEDYQISLGKLSTTAGSGNGYGNNMGILVKASGDNANNGRVDAPGDTDEYWSNSIDVSNYYRMGKIMPASSTDGQDVFFTPDAAGVGKTLKSGARYYTAVDNNTTKADGDTAEVPSGKEYTKTYETTLHAINNETRASDGWTPDNATAYNVTKDAGYYVDIPVWIRSSNTTTTQLAVDAYITTKSKVDDDDLYLAARAVILDSTKANTSGLLEIRPDSYTSPDNYVDDTKNTIVDYMTTTNATGAAVASITEGSTATYGATTNYDGDLLTTNVLQVPAGSNGKYGTGAKVFVRVWLEGEDPNCWNQNAGQDFSINLKFTRDRMYNSDAASTASVSQSYPDQLTFTPDTTSLALNDTVSVTIGSASMTYTWNGSAWYRTAGTFPEIPSGKCVLVSSTNAGTSEATFITWLGTNKDDKTKIATAVTATIGDIPAGG